MAIAPIDYATLAQISEQYPICLDTLRYWVKTGKLPAFKPGRRILVRRSDLDQVIADCAVGNVRASKARAARRGAK